MHHRKKLKPASKTRKILALQNITNNAFFLYNVSKIKNREFKVHLKIQFYFKLLKTSVIICPNASKMSLFFPNSKG